MRVTGTSGNLSPLDTSDAGIRSKLRQQDAFNFWSFPNSGCSREQIGQSEDVSHAHRSKRIVAAVWTAGRRVCAFACYREPGFQAPAECRGVIARWIAMKTAYGPSEKTKAAFHQALVGRESIPDQKSRSSRSERSFPGLQSKKITLQRFDELLRWLRKRGAHAGTKLIWPRQHFQSIAHARSGGSRTCAMCRLHTSMRTTCLRCSRTRCQDRRCVYLGNPNKPDGHAEHRSPRSKRFCRRFPSETFVG